MPDEQAAQYDGQKPKICTLAECAIAAYIGEHGMLVAQDLEQGPAADDPFAATACAHFAGTYAAKMRALLEQGK